VAPPPIALCEVQGYAFDAYDRLARLADQVMGDDDLASRLRGSREELAERFDAAFWTDDRGGYYALGLDGSGRQIQSLTSNIGHPLWSGIVSPDKARVLVDRLFSDDLWSGWGVRTAAVSDGGFSPLGYHTGTVWAHDNSLIAAGLHRYGFHDEGNRIASAMFAAAERRGYRLPEAFAGYARADTGFPVRYPTASDPQAWATAAPFLWIRLLLGLDVQDGALVANPTAHERFGALRLEGVPAAGRRWDVVLDHDGATEVSERRTSA
jgi:glycogen debranching enzyme